MQKLSLILTAAIFIVMPHVGAAGDTRPEHYKGKTSATWAEAALNLKSANAQLEALLNQDSITPAESAQIHELSYTMENALQKMRSQIVATEVLLETLHRSSESPDLEQTKRAAEHYLNAVGEIQN